MERKQIIVFGAGLRGRDFVQMTQYECKVLCIVDNDSTKWGKLIGGIEINPVEVLKQEQYKDILVVIAVDNYKSVVLQLEDMGIKNYVLWSLMYEADLQCKSREILDKYMPNGVEGHYTNNYVKNAWMNHLVGNYSDLDKKYFPVSGKILDVGCGCGKDLFHRLCMGYDAYGIDCCEWKMDFCNQKIDDFGFPQEWKEHFINGNAEKLPFNKGTFDVVSCWYVLEHLMNYKECIKEMLRVTKKGGYIYLNAPDYNGNYEKHYGIDFGKSLYENREEFREYLISIGADMSIYQDINFIRKKDVLEELKKYVEMEQGELEITDFEELCPETKVRIWKNRLIYSPVIKLVIKKIE